jgi:hypothetical protein
MPIYIYKLYATLFVAIFKEEHSSFYYASLKIIIAFGVFFYK